MFRRLLNSLMMLVLCLAVMPLHAELDPAFVKEIEQMREIYLKAVNGDKRDVRQAIRQVTALSSRYPDHPLVMVYKGGTLAQRGRDVAERPLNRMRDTEQGLNHIDRGLRLFDAGDYHFIEQAEAHLLATFLFVHLPDSVFHRLKQGQYLVDNLLSHPRFEEFPIDMRAGIYLAAAVAAEKHSLPDKQREYLELSLQASPEGMNSKEARTMLEALAD